MQREGAAGVSGAEAFCKGKEGQEHGDVIPPTKEEKEVRLRHDLPIAFLFQLRNGEPCLTFMDVFPDGFFRLFCTKSKSAHTF